MSGGGPLLMDLPDAMTSTYMDRDFIFPPKDITCREYWFSRGDPSGWSPPPLESFNSLSVGGAVGPASS